MATNDVIRTRVVRSYRQFVAEVDPRGGIMDHLIEAGVISIETKERIVSHVTRQDRCRAALDELLGSSHRQAFVVLERALAEHYPWIVDKLNQVSSDDCIDQVDSAFAATNVREMARRLEEVERNLRQSPTPNVERDLRRQIDDLTTTETQLKQRIGVLSAKNHDLQLELDNAKCQLTLKSEELSEAKDEVVTLRREAKANEMELRVRLEDSVERERMLQTKLDQAEVREKLLREEVRQAVQDERSQLTTATTEVMLTPAVTSQAAGDRNQAGGSSCVVGQLLDKLRSSSASVYGITVLADELYVARDRSHVIEVFDLNAPLWSIEVENFDHVAPMSSSSCHRRLTVTMTSLSQQVRPLDIASCVETRSLYVSDAANGRLHRVDPTSGRVLDSWKVDGRTWGLSVTDRGTVLVCCRAAGQLCEFTSSGQLVRRVRLSDDVAQPVHAVEVRSQFVVSHHDVDNANSAGARVLMVNETGNVQRVHSDQLSQPHHLATVTDGGQSLVAVTDCGNNRVKLLDTATLNVVGVVTQPRRPHRLCAHQGRLYVGQWDGCILVYQLSSASSAAQPYE